jgi:hypothetical protein
MGLTATEVLVRTTALTKRDLEVAKLERDLGAWLTEAVNSRRLLSQPPPVEIPRWFRDEMIRGVVLRVTLTLQ